MACSVYSAVLFSDVALRTGVGAGGIRSTATAAYFSTASQNDRLQLPQVSCFSAPRCGLAYRSKTDIESSDLLFELRVCKIYCPNFAPTRIQS